MFYFDWNIKNLLTDTDVSFEIYLGESFNSSAKLIDQCVNDNIENIIPNVAFFKNPPHIIKRKIGKGTWKAMHNSTFHENMISCSIYQSAGLGVTISEDIEIISNISRLSEIELWLIVNKHFSEDDKKLIIKKKELNQSINIAKKCVELYEHVNHKGNILELELDFLGCLSYLSNLVDLSENCEENINWKWSPKRIIEVHDEWSMRYNLDKVADSIGIDRNENFNLAKYIEKKIQDLNFNNNISITVLKSIDDFDKERQRMHHCIASYCQRSYEGKYVVFHIHDSLSDEHATLAFKSKTKIDGMGFKNISVGHNILKKSEVKSINNKPVKSELIKKTVENIDVFLNPSKGLLN